MSNKISKTKEYYKIYFNVPKQVVESINLKDGQTLHFVVPTINDIYKTKNHVEMKRLTIKHNLKSKPHEEFYPATVTEHVTGRYHDEIYTTMRVIIPHEIISQLNLSKGDEVDVTCTVNSINLLFGGGGENK